MGEVPDQERGVPDPHELMIDDKLIQMAYYIVLVDQHELRLRIPDSLLQEV